MAVNCTADALAESMACYQCIAPGHKTDALIVLLQVIAGTTYTADQLQELGAQYRGMDEARRWEAIVALLCSIAQSLEP